MKTTIKSQVTAAAETLTSMTTHTQLREWAVANGMDSRSGFSAFKKALKEIGLDYDAIRSGIQAAAADELSSRCRHEVTLITDAKARCSRFAICGGDGAVVWYGRFFDGEGSEQSAAELETAKKAIWLAGKVREQLGEAAIRLTLKVDAQWLTTLSGKAAVLASKASQANIDLVMEWIPGASNPADKWTVASGYKKWQETPLATLAQPIAA